MYKPLWVPKLCRGWSGGISVLVDESTMAAVVASGTDRVQASFAAVAKHYGAAVDVCPPRSTRHTGTAPSHRGQST